MKFAAPVFVVSVVSLRAVHPFSPSLLYSRMSTMMISLRDKQESGTFAQKHPLDQGACLLLPLRGLSTTLRSTKQQRENFDSKTTTSSPKKHALKFAILGAWLTSITAFVLINNFVQPWPAVMLQIPERVYFLFHMLGGTLFGGGIILSAAMERLVVSSKSETEKEVQRFWFDKVPLLDAVVVLPALTVSVVSGVGLSIQSYGGLNLAPPHANKGIFHPLVAFLVWWAMTDVSTQGKARLALREQESNDDDNQGGRVVPGVVRGRTATNIVSCLFVILINFIMVMKPGTTHL